MATLALTTLAGLDGSDEVGTESTRSVLQPKVGDDFGEWLVDGAAAMTAGWGWVVPVSFVMSARSCRRISPDVVRSLGLCALALPRDLAHICERSGEQSASTIRANPGKPGDAKLRA